MTGHYALQVITVAAVITRPGNPTPKIAARRTAHCSALRRTRDPQVVDMVEVIVNDQTALIDVNAVVPFVVETPAPPERLDRMGGDLRRPYSCSAPGASTRRGIPPTLAVA